MFVGGTTGRDWGQPCDLCFSTMKSMKPTRRTLACGLLIVLTSLMGSCSSGVHSTANRPHELSASAAASRPSEPNLTSYHAQVPTCWNSVSCCVQNNPLTPLQSCGVDPVQAAEILIVLEQLDEAAQTATLKGVDVPEREEERDDGEERENWREYCIEQYTRCIDLKWTGNCSSCLERCKGQRGIWPEDMCTAPTPKRKR